MDPSFLIRIGTRVVGKGTTAEIREMVLAGQVGDLHQVSLDGAKWEPATNYPEFFGAAGGAPNLYDAAPSHGVEEIPLEDASSNVPVVAPVTVPSPATQPGTWKVIIDGEPFGPYSTAEVEKYVADGRIARGDQVWQEGMTDWVPVQDRFAGVRKRKAAKPKKPRKEKPQVPREDQSRSILAVASFVFALLWGLGIGSLMAVILGTLAIYDIATSQRRTIGIWFALTGVLLGIIGAVIGVYVLQEYIMH